MRYFSLVFLLLSGCSSSTNTDSCLPWNKPADWQLHRDITATTTINKSYSADTFNKR